MVVVIPGGDNRVEGHLLEDPTFYLHDFDMDRGKLGFYRIRAEDIRWHCGQVEEAVKRTGKSYWLSLGEVANLLDQHPLPVRPLKHLFRIDYCCSTLVARLLEELPGSYVYNEPLIFHFLS